MIDRAELIELLEPYGVDALGGWTEDLADRILALDRPLNRTWPGRQEVLRSFGGDIDADIVDQIDRTHTPTREGRNVNPEEVLDVFFEEMEARNRSTSSRDVDNARAATLRRLIADGHQHVYAMQPSGRGVGFDHECRTCGHIRNRSPFV